MGIEQLDIFEEHGVPPHRVAIGHSDGNGRIPYLLNVLKRGAWLSFDRFGFGMSASDDVRIASLLGLLGLGHGNRIMLSHDSVCSIITRGGFAMPPELKDWKPTHLIKNIFPRLRDAGVSQATIDTMMVANPRRYFEGEPF
jgi:phosphotriesterase-related protein